MEAMSHAAKALGLSRSALYGGSSASDCDERRPISSRACHADLPALRKAGAR